MKSIDRNLYDRNGYYYYRAALPRNLHKCLLIREIRISLATQDLTQARINAAQLDFEVTKQVIALTSKLREIQPDHSLSSIIAEFRQSIDWVKSNAGHNPIRKIKGMGISGGGLLFSQVADKYLADCPLDAVSTRFYKVATFALFKELIGDKPFKDINQTDAQQFKAYLLKIPANAKKKFKIDSFENFDWNLIKDTKPQHPRTINNRLVNMSTLINWAERGGYYHQKNPFSRMTIRIQNKAKNRRHPFKREELQALFSCPIYTGCRSDKPKDRLVAGNVIVQDNFYWVPLIGLTICNFLSFKGI